MLRCVSRLCSIFLCLFALVCVLAGLSFLSAAPEAGKKYALLVGVNEYDSSDNLPKLDFAVNDVAEMRNVLAEKGYEVVLLTAAEAERKKAPSFKPTKDNIENQLKTLVKKFAKGDTLLIGLAGHGLQFEKDGNSYFCPVDARPFKGRTDTLVSIKWIYERLEQDAASGVKLLLVDACRNDPDKGRGRGLDADTVPPPPKGVGVLLSCASGQRSFEREKYRHGVFFHYVLEGLKGEAKDRKDNVTWDSLRSYVKEHVALDQEGQTPEESGRLAGIPPILVRLDKEKPPDDTTAKERPKTKTLTADLGGGVKMEFVLIPKGKFWMGSPKDEEERNSFQKAISENVDAEAQREVEIKEDFYLGVYTVTQGQYEAIMGDNPSWFSHKGGGADKVKDFTEAQLKNFPVENVSWEDAQKFIEKLNAKEKTRLYRLPSEAEWEYACRGGATSKDSKPFHFDKPTSSLSSTQANFNGKFPYGGAAEGPYLERTTKVGSYQPNNFGLYDMHGNVWQWTAELYKEEASGRVIRGGNWSGYGRYCRAACRNCYEPSHQHYNVGFRLARVPSGQ